MRFPVAVATSASSTPTHPNNLDEMLVNTPLFLYSEFDVRPLTDYDKYMENVAAALEKRER